MTMSSSGEAWLVYDGECPFCSTYVRLLRFRQSVGTVHLIDARDGGPLVDELAAAGFDLDEGMALKMGGRVYHGSDCVHAIALLSGDLSAFNRFNAWIFKSPARAKRVYPLLRAGRNAALALLGRRRLHGGRNAANP